MKRIIGLITLAAVLVLLVTGFVLTGTAQAGNKTGGRAISNVLKCTIVVK